MIVINNKQTNNNKKNNPKTRNKSKKAIQRFVRNHLIIVQICIN